MALCQDLAQKTINYTTSDILKFTRLAMGSISKRVRTQNKRSAWQVAMKECKSESSPSALLSGKSTRLGVRKLGLGKALARVKP
jgi:hypothetical protein